LARRASLLRTLVADPAAGPTTFLLAGTEELLRAEWDPQDHLTPHTAAALTTAYKAMGYNAVFLGPNECRLADLHFAEFPGNFICLGPHLATRVLTRGGVRLGLVLLPPPADGKEPDAETLRAVAREARALRSRADLVAGISCWGEAAEQHYLDTQEPVFDVLLGSGPGPVRGRIAAQGRTFWVRSYSEGRAVMVLRFFELPHGADWTMRPGENVELDVRRLGNDVPDAPDIAKLFSN
jgi:hypothetical protein